MTLTTTARELGGQTGLIRWPRIIGVLAAAMTAAALTVMERRVRVYLARRRGLADRHGT